MVHNGFTWRPGFPTKADANKFAEQLEALRAPDGSVAVEDVLAAQRDEEAPLHEEIEWDDAAAAHRYRLTYIHQALGALRVIPIDLVREEPMMPMRAMIPARMADKETGEPNTYVFTVTQQTQPEVMEVKAREQALGDIRKLANRIASLPGCREISERLIEFVELL